MKTTKQEMLDKIYDVSWATRWHRDGVHYAIGLNLEGRPRQTINSWGNDTLLMPGDPLHDLYMWVEINLNDDGSFDER